MGVGKVPRENQQGRIDANIWGRAEEDHPRDDPHVRTSPTPFAHPSDLQAPFISTCLQKTSKNLMKENGINRFLTD